MLRIHVTDEKKPLYSADLNKIVLTKRSIWTHNAVGGALNKIRLSNVTKILISQKHILLIINAPSGAVRFITFRETV